MIRATVSAAILLVSTLVPTFVWAQERYDCVIEPFLVVEIGSTDEGVIAEIDAQRGAAVTKGQIIARLESSVEEATLRMAETNATSHVEEDIARARVSLMQSSYNRDATLAAKKLTAQSELEVAQSELEVAKLELVRAEQNHNLAVLDRDRARAQLERRIIRSPVDGIILRRLIGPGEYVYSQAQIAQIATIDPLFIDVFLPSDHYNNISLGQVATVRPAAPIGGIYEAVVTSIDQVFDAASDTFGVRLELRNPGNKLPAGVDCEIDFNLG